MSFFQNFPKIQYDLQENNQPSIIHNIFRHVDVTSSNTDDFTTYTYYEIQDGDRPDVISQKIYGTPYYYWTFFIINDFLQAGFNEYYKSYQNLMRGIELEYDPYGVIIFTAEDSSFDGIDLTYDNLRIARYDSSSIESHANAKIKKWDSSMMQLITYEPTNFGRFYLENGIIGPQFYLKFADPTLATNIEWLAEFNELRVAQGRSKVSSPEEVFFTARDIVNKMINAPYRYTAQDIVNEDRVQAGDELLAYDALVRGWGDATLFQSYYDFEVQRNEMNRQIRVVNPIYIERFVDEYRRLINL